MTIIARTNIAFTALTIFLLGVLTAALNRTHSGSGLPNDRLIAYHFDVGQADATLIRSHGCNILIDAGHWNRDDMKQHLLDAAVDEIDLMVLTHPHADHIGQADAVLSKYAVHEVWASGWEHDSQTFERTIDAISDSGASYEEPRAGYTEQCGTMMLEVIHPVDVPEQIHDNLALRVHHRHAVLLYTGDAEADHERDMIQREDSLEADWLHLGHHGSRTSSSPEFLDAVDPAGAIYSAGEDNQFGHPHDEVVRRVADRDIALYGTAEHGTVMLVADGEGLHIRTHQWRLHMAENGYFNAYAFLDRIEDGQGIFLIEASREEVSIDEGEIPVSVRAGTWVSLRCGPNGQVLGITAGPARGSRMRQRIGSKMQQLRRRKKRT